MTTPLVSVVIPTRDRRDDVRVAVRSAVAQTWPANALEIIVVDDGGSDDTGEALAAEHGKRVRYLWKPHGGPSSARNLGIEASRGAYLALLDSDDEWRPTKIERQVALLESNADLGMALTGVERMTSDRRTIDVWRRRDQIPHDGHVLPHVLRQPSLIASTAVFRRAVYDRTEGFAEHLLTAEDIDFHLRVALEWGIGLVEEPLTRWTDVPPSRSRTFDEYLLVVERFVAAHGHLVGRDVCDEALILAYERNGRGFLDSGDVANAVRCGIKGLRRVLSRSLVLRRFAS